ncbi:MAG: AAA family ATPase [Muribaculaceae bacterium]|nr:AAA family ATPase [Muribaculaceae bacterium]
MVRGFEMYGIMNNALLNNSKAKQFIKSHISEDPTCYSDPHLNTATVDLGYYISRRYKSLKSSLKSTTTSSMNPFIQKAKSILENKKNIILQGAPGTGKTYNTAALALSVLGISEVDLENHLEVMQKYDSLIGSQIFFTTFHQSMDYEDFIEGIKPRIQTDEDGNPTGVVTYEPEDGIFKNACSSVSTDEDDNIIEWIDDFISKIKGFENKVEIPTMSGRSSFFAWWNEGNKTISTRSKTSTYSAGEERSPAPLNIQKIKDQAVGRGIENNWPRYSQAFIEFVRQRYSSKRKKAVVLIIDEINRGNVSKVFGELITIIEKDKRLGADHPITVTLPYSKTIFGVPENLYIIGTMNTTDRSTGTIDYALRRRFAFLTVPSEKKHIESETGKKLFDSVKEFIEKFRFADMDVEDLMVGHSYFMAEDDEDLKLKVQYEIIPLIKEYIKDGILRVNPAEQKKYLDAWSELETLEDNDNGTSED